MSRSVPPPPQVASPRTRADLPQVSEVVAERVSSRANGVAFALELDEIGLDRELCHNLGADP